MYVGKEICQGCGKSGLNKPRKNKNSLCENCSQLLRISLENQHEDAVDYISVRDWIHGFSSYDFKDKSLDTLANEIFAILHNDNADAIQHCQTIRSQAHGSVYYNIPISIKDPLLTFFDNLANRIRDVRRYIEESEEIAHKAVQKERDKIYNEGLEKGKKLLLQLNSGNLTMAEFEKTISYETDL